MNSRTGISVIFWYSCTVISTIYSKRYLAASGDPYSLSLLSVGIGALGSLLYRPRKDVSIDRGKLYPLAMLHLATTLLTNISLGKASVAFTYMVKAAEPIFAAVLCRLVLNDRWPFHIYLSLLPIFFGVSLTAGAEMNFSLIGLFSALASNLASSSRNVFFKSTLKELSVNWISAYFEVCRGAFTLLAPLYGLGVVAGKWSKNVEVKTLDSTITNDASTYLVLGASLHFAYNLFSFAVLDKLSPVTHAVTNVMKRVMTIISSLLYFGTPFNLAQFFGFILANTGVGWYSYAKMKFKETPNGWEGVSASRLEWRKSACIKAVGVIVLMTIATDFLGVFHSVYAHRSRGVRELNRRECLRKIKSQTLNAMGPLLPEDARYVIIDLATHTNLGDNFLSLGEQKLIHGLDRKLVGVCTLSTKRSCSFDRVGEYARDNVTLLIHAGGNFGTLWGYIHAYRMKVFSNFRTARMLSLPQSVYYDKEPKNDAKIMADCPNLTLTWRSRDSLQYAQENFPQTPSFFVPDMAFMIGDVIPDAEPVVDIVFLVRSDRESVHKSASWKEAQRLLSEHGISYEHVDWKLTKDQETFPGFDVGDLLLKRLHIANRLLSRGKLIVADRLHAIILSTLMGKPHIYLDNSYKKITQVRKAAFADKPECSDENLQAEYADNPLVAAEMAIKRLHKL
ncbi:uncharacterized protein SPPG_09475 [Spizellomyces punctatus DAOM BR117]|uniref:Sugar phosphate transporter domain-containing protein n=1 Tax=Spizellomyces punctatus (strain DAOM BR117) TaxID=645134 RepID=A0A0L0H837_SPIPD|nr:uncharacterized protein SPPG_09475 [Spizellomyces punctatus DAOM BR117]KNC97094.1 hypothetical protein SPPG_09475 [Spizellomyces punctatus DAOM BR117]|eukprot:XP_016605134.1 hypothetical protein SPPG_09475 [Spizellomyces punctatus DAOM BR117]